ncbi:cysteine-rich CWC family protein [Caballeronia fortuita]|uniref:cysteine-rich CWC family protein n=1 Tax=Caballeronia fortuita TaxID=1777138 RepID=UPI001FC9F512|nr:cysteine-rich CWC family protein [Caballeronia fortuita]
MRSSFVTLDDKMMNPSSEMDERRASDAQVCARCGAAFRCGALAGDPSCWCATLPALPADRLRAGMRCLCPACLAARIANAASAD